MELYQQPSEVLLLTQNQNKELYCIYVQLFILVLHMKRTKGDDTMEISSQEVYRMVFKEYPDILNVKQVSKLLGVSTKTIYKLINQGSLSSLKVGREFRVTKVMLMKYMKVLGNSPSTILE